jgi:hypothetical protein
MIFGALPGAALRLPLAITLRTFGARCRYCYQISYCPNPSAHADGTDLIRARLFFYVAPSGLG